MVWIVGGLLKGVELEELVRAHVARLRAVVIIGADRSVLRAAFARHAPALTVREVQANETGDVMVSAVRLAAEHARAGDVVLLPSSPALAMRVLATLSQPFTTSSARQALSTTRRVAIPLLEHLDGRGWTHRLDGGHREVVATVPHPRR